MNIGEEIRKGIIVPEPITFPAKAPAEPSPVGDPVTVPADPALVPA